MTTVTESQRTSQPATGDPFEPLSSVEFNIIWAFLRKTRRVEVATSTARRLLGTALALARRLQEAERVAADRGKATDAAA